MQKYELAAREDLQVLILSEEQPYLCVLVSLLCCALGLRSWIRKCHDNWLLHDPTNTALVVIVTFKYQYIQIRGN